jgi:hypothetical protein
MEPASKVFRGCYSAGSPQRLKAILSSWFIHFTGELIMGKGNNSQKNDKKSKKPKQDKAKGGKAAAKK